MDALFMKQQERRKQEESRNLPLSNPCLNYLVHFLLKWEMKKKHSFHEIFRILLNCLTRRALSNQTTADGKSDNQFVEEIPGDKSERLIARLLNAFLAASYLMKVFAWDVLCNYLYH